MLNRRILLITTAFLLFSGAATAGEFEKVIVFGDSLSDTGNTYLATGRTFPPPPYFDGRFTDGWIWVEYLADDIDAQLPDPSLGSGNNFAWGGAESVNGTSSVGVPGVGAQVTEYLGSVGGIADPDALYVVSGGGNDILLAGTDSRIAAANIADAVERLLNAGARQVLVANLMNLGLSPALQAGFDPFFNPNSITADQFRAASFKFNLVLRIELRKLRRAYRDTEITHLNAARVLRRFVIRPWRFGIENLTDPAVGTENASTSLWWDAIHTTTIFHRALADHALRSLDRNDDHDED